MTYRWNWVRKWKVWTHFRNFFPIHLIKTTEIGGDHNYIMCYHPHGLLCAGAFSTFATEGTRWSEVITSCATTLTRLRVLEPSPPSLPREPVEVRQLQRNHIHILNILLCFALLVHEFNFNL